MKVVGRTAHLDSWGNVHHRFISRRVLQLVVFWLAVVVAPGVAGCGSSGPNRTEVASDSGAGGTSGASGNTATGGSVGIGGNIGMAGNNGAAGAGASCSRATLKSAVDGYFTGLAAHTSASLPVAPNVKFTENGKILKVGQDGLWKTAGMLRFAISAFDTEGCATATEAVVADGTMDIPFALRLKLQNQQITEIESIAVHPGDYRVNGATFASDTGAIIMSDASVHWQDSVPAGERNTARELDAWMTKYFNVFPNGVCNTASACKRLENGGGSFSCSAGAACSSGSGSGAPVLKSHAVFADVETGIGVGFDNFMGNCDMHIFKMYGGVVYAVHAVLGACSSTGWD